MPSVYDDIPKILRYKSETYSRKIQNEPRLISGEWRFSGYYPNYCKKLPNCYLYKLGLNLDRKYDRKNYLCFSTKAEFKGNACEEKLKEFSDVGYTWFKGNRLMQTKENGTTPGW